MAREMLYLSLALAPVKVAASEDFLPRGRRNRDKLAPLGCGRRLNGVRLINGDNANFGQQVTEGGHGKMDMITRMFVAAREYQRGQTMTEYALILAAVAVVVFLGYQTMGTTIKSVLTSVDAQL
jgi:Flp pilus assembly pilin Flp